MAIMQNLIFILSIKLGTLLGIIAGVLLVLLVIGLILANYAYKIAFGRLDNRDEEQIEALYEKQIKGYKIREESFYSGKNRLQGYHLGENNTKGLVVFSHGLWCDHRNYIAEVLYMVDAGWRVFTYDATGCGKSEGNSAVGLVQSAFDLEAALEFIDRDPVMSKMEIVNFGHSWGAYAAVAVLNRPQRLKATVSISAYAYPLDMFKEVLVKAFGNKGKFFYPFVRTVSFFKFGPKHNLSAVTGLEKAQNPVLVVHGGRDMLIDRDGSSLYAYRHKVNNPHVYFMKLEDSGHMSILSKKDFNFDRDELIKNTREAVGEKIDENLTAIRNKDIRASDIDLVEVLGDIFQTVSQNEPEDEAKINTRLLRVVDFFLSRYIDDKSA